MRKKIIEFLKKTVIEEKIPFLFDYNASKNNVFFELYTEDLGVSDKKFKKRLREEGLDNCCLYFGGPEWGFQIPEGLKAINEIFPDGLVISISNKLRSVNFLILGDKTHNTLGVRFPESESHIIALLEEKGFTLIERDPFSEPIDLYYEGLFLTDF